MPNFIDKRNWKEDHFQSYIKEDPNTGKKRLKIITPSMVVHIGDKDELKLQLDHYKKPVIGDLVPNTKLARRHLVEHVRPALRYWCTKFGVEVPDWLQNEERFTQLSPEEKMEMFGTDRLDIREFKKFKRTPMPSAEGEDEDNGPNAQ